MVAMASDEKNCIDYFKKIKIVPVSISYEYDPTDSLKIPQLLAIEQGVKYEKKENEDLDSIIAGIFLSYLFILTILLAIFKSDIQGVILYLYLIPFFLFL